MITRTSGCPATCFACGSVKIARHGNMAPGLAPSRAARIRDKTTTEETGQGTGIINSKAIENVGS